jgi:general transcription factor 3C polypeptide 3 (transcription factor C subunit 4)
MRIHLADAYSLKGDLSNALKHIKVPAERWPESRHIWNIFTRIVIDVGGVRQTAKFIGNLRKEHPSSIPLALLQGHVHLQNYSYENALAEYMDAFRLDPQEPLVMLCISNLFANYACSRNANDRVRSVIQSFAWLQESGRNRINPVETAYNAGRLAQQFSLMHLAIPLYREALHYYDELQIPDIGRMELDETGASENVLLETAKRANFAQAADFGARQQDLSGTSDLSREAAFNLSLILRESGADAAAKLIMRKYLTF